MYEIAGIADGCVYCGVWDYATETGAAKEGKSFDWRVFAGGDSGGFWGGRRDGVDGFQALSGDESA